MNFNVSFVSPHAPPSGSYAAAEGAALFPIRSRTRPIHAASRATGFIQLRQLPLAVMIIVMAVMASTAVGVEDSQGWSTAQLSVARYELAATSVGNVALFALGYTGSELLLNGPAVLMIACLFSVVVRGSVVAVRSHCNRCRLCFKSCRPLQQCNRSMVNSSTQHSSLSSCSYISRKYGLVCFRCGGRVQQCNRDVVDGSAQRSAQPACSHVSWQHGDVRWWRNSLARYLDLF